jgi:uncharacterized protein (UPF0303 family)
MSRDIPDFTIEEIEEFMKHEFVSFSNDDAVDLGLTAVEVISDWELNLAVDIVIGEDLVFRAKLGTTGPGNDQWLAGKARVARMFGEPSLLVRLRHEADGGDFTDRDDVDHETHKAHGGSIPIFVAGELVATITMSGEPDRIDHEAAAEAIRRYLDASD